MKRLVITIIVILNVPSFAQNISFLTSADNHQLIYGIYNRIILQSEKEDCSQYFLKSENATIIKKHNCSYFIIPKVKDVISVSVYKSNHGDTLKIEDYSFSVGELALNAKIGGLSGGGIRKTTFKVQRGVIVSVDYSITPFSGDVRFSIIEHSILILRNGKSIYQETMEGPAFSQELKNKLQDLQVNDKVFLYDVKAKGPDGHVRKVAPVIFEIID